MHKSTTPSPATSLHFICLHALSLSIKAGALSRFISLKQNVKMSNWIELQINVLHKLLIVEALTSKGDYDDNYRSRGNPVHTLGFCPPPLLNFLLPLVPLSFPWPFYPVQDYLSYSVPVSDQNSSSALGYLLLPREKRLNKFYHVFTLEYALLGSVGEKSTKTSRSSCSSGGRAAGMCVSAYNGWWEMLRERHGQEDTSHGGMTCSTIIIFLKYYFVTQRMES